ncbi:MAG TPA: sensor histidine kinase [Candidatus Limnocylindrales bacterium]|nr:sensor histidine kinase [Candidatus Limnocylindrales bacterium]
MTSVAGVTTNDGILRRLAADTGYVLAGFPIAIASFVVLITGFALSIGLLPLFGVGVFVGAGTMLVARVFADLQRLRLQASWRKRPLYKRSEGSIWSRTLRILGDLQSWLDWVHGATILFIAVITFSLVVTWWAAALGGLTNFLWDWSIPYGEDSHSLAWLLGFEETSQNRVAINTIVGAGFLLTLPLMTRGCALLQASYTRALLTGVAEVRNTIEGLRDQRAAAVSAEATALRKLERDIHDGPQQRLVRLAMDISRARQQLDEDPERARSTLDEALGQTRETLDELRSLSRGIAPPILVDRGLPAAVTAVAGRAAVPVDLAVDPSLAEQRPQPEIENAAYFVVTEALANAAKHSRATRCEVTIVRAMRMLGVLVRDNGVGGAHVSKGHGLAGLADRVRAAGGRLTVTSPPNEGTEIRVELPE